MQEQSNKYKELSNKLGEMTGGGNGEGGNIDIHRLCMLEKDIKKADNQLLDDKD